MELYENACHSLDLRSLRESRHWRSLPADLQPADLGGKGQGVKMREYVSDQTGELLRHLAFQVTRTARTGDAEAIHDLRVAIRRLSRCLRVQIGRASCRERG